MPPLATAFTAIGSFFTGLSAGFAATSVGAFLTTTFLGKLLTTIALTALQIALQPKPKIPAASITTEYTQTGGTNSHSFILGHYATAGTFVTPPYTWGSAGKTPNAYLTYVIALSAKRGVTLSKFFVNKEEVLLDGATDPDLGTTTLGKFANHVWVKYYDGSQIAADPWLVSEFGAHPDFPWSSTMIGLDICYAIVTFRFNNTLHKSLPNVLFEVDGIPLYDPRLDTTVGGSGTHRWDDPTTWEQTTNPQVMNYNILRGITMPDGAVWGGRASEGSLNLTEWFAAMNECDVSTPRTPTGTEAAYRAGYEVKVDMLPIDVVNELNKTCSASIVEQGGFWRVRVGPPALPIYAFTDDDVIVSADATQTPFPTIDEIYNGIQATYPDPDSNWSSIEAPALYNATYEAEDHGFRQIADLQLSACPYDQQVQRLMRAYIDDQRRFIIHAIALPPDAATIEVLDTVSWTSTEYGYTAKLFEVKQIVYDYNTMVHAYLLRERDPDDYTPGAITLPQPVNPSQTVIPALDIPSYLVTPYIVKDDLGNDRRPAIQVSWDGTDLEGYTWVETQVRVSLTSTMVVYSDLAKTDTGFQIISNGIVPGTEYEVRSRLVSANQTNWTTWHTVLAPSVYITDDDFFNGIAQLFKDAGLSAPAIVSTLPPSGAARYQGELVFLTTDNKLYRWDGANWIATVPTSDLTGVLDISSFATTLRPPEVLAALPGTGAGNYIGRMVFLTTDGKLYRNTTGADDTSGWTVEVAGTDITANSITAGQIAAAAIGATEIAAGAITTSKLAVTDLSSVFSDAFVDNDAFNEDWESISGTGETGIIASSIARGGLALRVGFNDGDDGRWYAHKRLIPFDPDKTYKLSTRLYKVAGAGFNFVGWMGIAADGVTRIHPTLGTTVLEGHWHCASDADPAVGSYTLYEGYTKGHGASEGTTGVGTYASPGQMHPNVRFLRPMIRLVSNPDTSAGQVAMDYFDVFALSAATLIEPNAITTNQITAGGVNADRITAGTITGGLLAASAIITNAAQINDALITNAKIANATIQGAKIANLAVDTLNVAGNAISTVETVVTAGSVAGSGTWATVQSLVVNKGRTDPMPVLVSVDVTSTSTTGNDSNPGRFEGYIRVKTGSTVIKQIEISYGSTAGVSTSANDVYVLLAVDNTGTVGSRTLSVEIMIVTGQSMTATNRVITALNLLK